MRFVAHRHGPDFAGLTLVATALNADEHLAGSVVFVCAHEGAGAMGIVLNREAADRRLGEILRQLGLVESEDAVAGSKALATSIVMGGPRDTDRGFVLHTPDFRIDDTSEPGPGVHLTVSVEILKAIAEGKGPDRAVLAFGHVEWDAGALEREIKDGLWLPCDTDQDCVFGTEHSAKHARALCSMGIPNAAALSLTVGRA